METRKVSQRAELVIKSAIIKPTHLKGRYDWSIVLSFDITLLFRYYSGPSVNLQIRRIYFFGNVIYFFGNVILNTIKSSYFGKTNEKYNKTHFFIFFFMFLNIIL